jgi:hypothetical protein
MTDKDSDSHKFEQLKIIYAAKTEVGHESYIIFSIFCAANAVLLAALFQSSDHYILWIKWLVVSIAGLILSITWFILQRRINYVMKSYEDLVAKLEDEFFSDNYQSGIKNKSLPHPVEKGGLLGAKCVMVIISLLGEISWAIILFIGMSTMHIRFYPIICGIIGFIIGVVIAFIFWTLTRQEKKSAPTGTLINQET